MKAAIARHDAVIDQLVVLHGGQVRDHAGDGVFATFDGHNPLNCALEIQLALQREDWSEVGGLLVRIGVHSGARTAGGAEDQLAINRAARITATAWGGQIVVSADATQSFAAPADSRVVDLGFCRVKGIDEPLRLFGLIHDQLNVVEFPPLRSLSVPSHAIAQPCLPFFGREKEYAELRGALESEHSRLVTLVGSGGNGKTRLADRLASDFSRTRAVWFVSLDTVSNGTELLSAIALALRVPFHGRQDRLKQLLEYLRDKQALLVLDNADAIVNECDLIADLSSNCPQLRILVTAREPLRLAAQCVYKLKGFELLGRTPHDLRDSPAYKIFAHEAEVASDEFKLTEGDFESFRSLCQMLNGSPLGLRLAAQWCPLLTIEQIAAKVREGLDFLRTTNSDVPIRQRSLRSVFDGSWTLLAGVEQQALKMLAIFAGDFDTRAAQATASVNLETLAALERKGLIERRQRDRLDVHSLIREFAIERLRQTTSDEQVARDRHSAYYLNLVRSEFSSIGSINQCLILNRIEQENANILSAWRHAIQSGAHRRVWAAAEPLFYALVLRARYRDAVSFFSAVPDDKRYEAYFMSLLANCLAQQGNLAEAETTARHALTGSTCAPVARAHSLQALGLVSHARGDLRSAKKFYEDSLAIQKKRRDLLGRYFSSVSLAVLHLLRREVDDARGWISECFSLCQRVGNTSGVMLLHFLVGEVALCQGRTADAKTSYQRSLKIEEAVVHPQHRSRVLIRLGSIFSEPSETEEAARWYREALAVATDFGDRRYVASALLGIGALERARGEYDAARNSILAAVRLALDLGMRPILLQGLVEMGRLDIALGNNQRAQHLANTLSDVELGPLRDAYAKFVADLPRDSRRRTSRSTPEAAARAIIDEDVLASLLH